MRSLSCNFIFLLHFCAVCRFHQFLILTFGNVLSKFVDIFHLSFTGRCLINVKKPFRQRRYFPVTETGLWRKWLSHSESQSPVSQVRSSTREAIDCVVSSDSVSQHQQCVSTKSHSFCLAYEALLGGKECAYNITTAIMLFQSRIKVHSLSVWTFAF